MKLKNIPPLIMLTAGAIASIIMYINSYELQKFLLILFFVLLIFYLLGSALTTAIEQFGIQNEKEEKERFLMEALKAQEEMQNIDMDDGDRDGSVIEKR